MKEFIENPGNRADLPEKDWENVPLLGKRKITKYHVISLCTHRGTSYGTYVAVQNELSAAYNELRDNLSMKEFGVHYLQLEKEDLRRKAVENYYPLKLSEAETVRE